MFGIAWLLLPCVICGVILADVYVPSMNKHPDEDADKGYFTNCGKLNFTLYWSPKIVSTKGFIKIHLRFISDCYWSEGFAKAIIRINDQPFIEAYKPLRCSSFSTFSPSKCPIENNQLVEAQYSGSAGVLIPGVIVDIHAELLDKKKKSIMCAKGIIKIKEISEEEM